MNRLTATAATNGVVHNRPRPPLPLFTPIRLLSGRAGLAIGACGSISWRHRRARRRLTNERRGYGDRHPARWGGAPPARGPLRRAALQPAGPGRLARYHRARAQRIHLLGGGRQTPRDPREAHRPGSGGARGGHAPAMLLARVRPPRAHRRPLGPAPLLVLGLFSGALGVLSGDHALGFHARVGLGGVFDLRLALPFRRFLLGPLVGHGLPPAVCDQPTITAPGSPWQRSPGLDAPPQLLGGGHRRPLGLFDHGPGAVHGVPRVP